MLAKHPNELRCIQKWRWQIESILNFRPCSIFSSFWYVINRTTSLHMSWINNITKNGTSFYNHFITKSVEKIDLTKKTASLAAMARISAHETTPGHCFSSSCLISSITLYPLKLKFAGESFSAVFSLVESIRTDPSHPYFIEKNINQPLFSIIYVKKEWRDRRDRTSMKQSWKCILTKPAARVGSSCRAVLTLFLTIESTKGQLNK